MNETPLRDVSCGKCRWGRESSAKSVGTGYLVSSISGPRFCHAAVTITWRRGEPDLKRGRRSCFAGRTVVKVAEHLTAWFGWNFREFGSTKRTVRARSSAGEHYVDIVGVTGSIPVAPTIQLLGFA